MCDLRTFLVLSAIQISYVLSDAATDYNKINNDGSFSFGLSNNDVGGHYHEASGSADKVVRGRYGARNPASGRIEETVYSAGPRGFRARGPRIHRKMDLAQYPVGPIGTKDDPLADPYEDPSYSFGFRKSDHERQEDADRTGRVRGLYSYLDDVGERHTVRYAAGAGTGFEVLNAVPDSPANVGYNQPLYKAPKGARGRMATVRGPDGQYRFILSAPDQRRSESSGPDGVVRGSYSYLDDKGVQRTVQYIAGAGIGYRVVQSTTGIGTHLSPRPALPELDIRDQQSNDLADDGYLKTSESGRFRPTDRDRDYNDDRQDKYDSFGDRNSNNNRDRYDDRKGSYSGSQSYNKGSQGFSSNERVESGHGSPEGSYDTESWVKKNHGENKKPEWDRNDRGDRRKQDFDNKSPGYDYNQGSLGSNTRYGENDGYNYDRGSAFGSKIPKDRHESSYSNNNKFPSSGEKGTKNEYPPREEFSPNRNKVPNSSRPDPEEPEYYNSKEHAKPVITTDRNRLQGDRDSDWITLGRDSTIIKNVGKWYVGLPPGSAVRAHVQNIDLLPLGGRQPSPSDALRRDELISP